jgi:pyridoxal phosphate enzyme (YggS family)
MMERISLAASTSGRSVDEIRVVAISKGQPVEAILAAEVLGLRDIGENRVEEALMKQGQCEQIKLTWHMVGHIQSRKAKDIPANFSWVHSIDRVKIAERLNRFGLEQNHRMAGLLECNVSGEASKYGWDFSDRGSWRSTIEALETIFTLPGLEICGLMTMAPWVEDEKILRKTFQTLRQLRDFMEEQLDYALPELSMGMSDDFPIAIEEGATMVRIGRAIFGPREG